MPDPADEVAYRVEAPDAGRRLDRFLADRLPDFSRTTVQRRIAEGAALVDGKVARAGYRLSAGEEVRFYPGPPPHPPRPDAPEAIPLDVLYEDDSLLVLNKPRGLVVHPAPGHPAGTLLNALLGRAAADPSRRLPERAGLVHRLDRDTTGLMVVARTDRALRSLQRQLARRTLERRYVVLVRGTPRWEEATVDAPIGRHPKDRKRMTVLPEDSPHRHRRARTHFRVLQAGGGFALLEARLETGRTHQVRVHCAYMRLPVVGDPLYGPREAGWAADLPEPARAALAAPHGQALHAARLDLEHPDTGRRMVFQAAPPADLQALLAALGFDPVPEPCRPDAARGEDNRSR